MRSGRIKNMLEWVMAGALLVSSVDAFRGELGFDFGVRYGRKGMNSWI
jgi:hypothetical protein